MDRQHNTIIHDSAKNYIDLMYESIKNISKPTDPIWFDFRIKCPQDKFCYEFNNGYVIVPDDFDFSLTNEYIPEIQDVDFIGYVYLWKGERRVTKLDMDPTWEPQTLPDEYTRKLTELKSKMYKCIGFSNCSFYPNSVNADVGGDLLSNIMKTKYLRKSQ